MLLALGLSVPQGAVSLLHQVKASLREAILFGSLTPGQRLNERELCSEMKISRTLLREAIQHLTAEGLVVSLDRRGHAIVLLGEKDARDIHALRSVLEPMVVAGFIENATNRQRQALRDQFDRLAASRPGVERFVEERIFFGLIVEGCGNGVAREFMMRLCDRALMLRRAAMFEGRRTLQRLSELRAIVEAIEARDAGRARELCLRRVEQAERASASVFERTRRHDDAMVTP